MPFLGVHVTPSIDKNIYLGPTAIPALGAENSVKWEHHEDPIFLAKKIKKQKIKLVLLEQTKFSGLIHEKNWNFPLCIVLGNEVEGVSENLIKLCDDHVEIPMNGIKQSLNVSVAAGIIGYEILRCYNNSMK